MKQQYVDRDHAWRMFLRDLHAVTGFWLSLIALFYLITALPLTIVWGQSFKYVRGWGQTREVKQDWTTGPASAQAQRLEAFRDAPATDEHAEHMASESARSGRISGFDQLATRVAPLELAGPVFLTPPSTKSPNWVARSESQNRPLRETLEFDPRSFELVKHTRFGDRPVIDRIFGVGIAAHEGQRFGWLNQVLGLVTAIGYLVLVVTSTLMWWRRRPQGMLGAPATSPRSPRLASFVVCLTVILGVFLPMLGASLVMVLLAEMAVRRFAPGLSTWLGLAPATRDATA